MKSATRIQYHTYTIGIRTPATAVAFIRHTRIQTNVGMEPTLPIPIYVWRDVEDEFR